MKCLCSLIPNIHRAYQSYVYLGCKFQDFGSKYGQIWLIIEHDKDFMPINNTIKFGKNLTKLFKLETGQLISLPQIHREMVL